MRKRLVFYVTIMSLLSPVVSAEMEAGICISNVPKDLLKLPDSQPELPEGWVDIKAKETQFIRDGVSVFSGDVHIVRDEYQLRADTVTYHKGSATITASDNITFSGDELIIQGNEAEWITSLDEGAIIDTEYWLINSRINGKAKYISWLGKQKTRLKNASYTTCQQDDPSWNLTADNVTLDHQQAVGRADNVILRIADIPVFYTPYLNFPLDDKRKSGLLTPSFGTSKEGGVDFTLPYYWNISPSQDLTISPRYISDRGIKLDTEYRYLNAHGGAKLDLGWLESDDLARHGTNLNPYYGRTRKHAAIIARQRITDKTDFEIDYNYVSDNDYLEDFGSNLAITSTTRLNRKAILSYHSDKWRVTGRLQGYQVLTETTDPYQRLPQIELTTHQLELGNGVVANLNAEYVAFQHDSLVEGQRIHLMPSLQLPLKAIYGFMTPSVAIQQTYYDLSANENSIEQQTIHRTIPVFQVDSGLFFDRQLTVAQSDYTQTIEPRAFYVYIPEKDQEAIPLFDSSRRTFGFNQLFNYQRYTGLDRVGDANQLSLAVTTRLIDNENGRERLKASIGQIHYFSQHKVLLPDEQAEKKQGSDMVAELVAELASYWHAELDLQWDPHESWHSSLAAMQVKYKGPDKSLFNVSYRYRSEDTQHTTPIEQLDISARLPVGNQWHVFGRYYQSLRESTLLEGLIGFEYDSCCWATRFMVRDYVNDANDTQRNLALLFQIELYGLGNIGQATDTFLSQSITGFNEVR